MDGGLWYCTRGSNQGHSQEKEMEKGKTVAEEDLQKLRKEEKLKAKAKRKHIILWMQSSKEEQGEIRKPASVINAKK